MMRKNKKYYSIMIVPHETGKMRTFRVSVLTLRLLLFVALFIVAGAAIFLVNQGRLISLAMRASEFAQKNQELQRKNAIILELADRVDRMEELYHQIGGMLGANVQLSEPESPWSPPAEEKLAPLSDTRLVYEAGKMIPGEFASRGHLDGEGARPSSWPLTQRGYVTRTFSLDADRHTGIDIAVPRNTPVKATGDGVVVEARYEPIYGNYVLIEHANGFSTLYAHNSRLCVRQGQRVMKDEIIAFSGSSGRSTAPHLHYELRKNNAPVDPQLYLR
jgi:murein DD-endopeptidase MepM/ murein hydrolase activator NlpD